MLCSSLLPPFDIGHDVVELNLGIFEVLAAVLAGVVVAAHHSHLVAGAVTYTPLPFKAAASNARCNGRGHPSSAGQLRWPGGTDSPPAFLGPCLVTEPWSYRRGPDTLTWTLSASGCTGASSLMRRTQ